MKSVDHTQRELELAAIVDAYNAVTDRLKVSHEQLGAEVRRLREELSRKNRQLRRRERLAALGELAAGVAHEIRNPLGGIRMFASLLRRDLSDRPESQRLVDKIERGVSRLERIVTDILEFGRPDEPNPEPVMLAMLLAEVCELAAGLGHAEVATAAQADKRPGSELVFELSRELKDMTIVTDAALLQRVLLNLSLNGLQAGEAAHPGAARVHLRAAVVGERIFIEVVDNGPGVPEELRERIFNPFFTTKETGTGLGLAIVHQTVELLGGSVTAGEVDGGGAVFTVNLPLDFEAVERGEMAKHGGRTARRSAALSAVRDADVDVAA